MGLALLVPPSSLGSKSPQPKHPFSFSLPWETLPSWTAESAPGVYPHPWSPRILVPGALATG